MCAEICPWYDNDYALYSVENTHGFDYPVHNKHSMKSHLLTSIILYMILHISKHMYHNNFYKESSCDSVFWQNRQYRDDDTMSQIIQSSIIIIATN